MTILGRTPDCPDCGCPMQRIPREGRDVWRCPWVSHDRWSLGISAGVTIVSCDRPKVARHPNGILPYREL